MAEEKGLIALNHCNNIANAIITKLGGTGYKPSEWREKVNLLGISSADKSEVLAGLTPEASGEEAGLIDLETISGLAEELNEKYTTIRGFKPSEMRGAISAMSPLEEKTASGSIAHYTDGAKNTPLTKCEVALAPSVAGRNPATVSGSIVSFSDSAEVGLKACKVTIPASLDGVSSVDVVHTGLQLLPATIPANGNGITYTDNEDGTFNAKGQANATISNRYVFNSTNMNTLKRGETYYISGCPSGGASNTYKLQVWNSSTSSQLGVDYGDGGSFTMPQEGAINVRFVIYSGQNVDFTVKPMITAVQTTEHEQYYHTIHTANLGRTIYGGEVDVVNGTGTENTGKAAFTGSENWQLYSNETFWYTTITADHIKTLQDCTTSNGVVVRFQSTSGQLRVYLASNVGVVDTTTDMNALLSNGVSFNYPYEAPVAFTFPRVPIVPKAGVNTMWSAGDISVDYYKDGYGYEEVKVHHEGKNIMPPPDGEEWEVGDISNATGRNVVNSGYRRTIGYIPVKGGANTWLIISGCTNAGTHDKLRIFRYDANKNYLSYENESARYAIGEGVAYIRVRYGIADVTFEDAQMEYAFDASATATAYEPYTEPEEKIKDLGGIVYGGSYDFVAGETKATYKRADLGALTWVKSPTAGYADLYYTDDLKEEIGATSGSQAHGLCYEFEVVTNDGHDGSDSSATPQPYNTIRFRASDGRIYLKVAGYTTAAEMKAGVAGVMLLYALHDPEAIEGTPEDIRSYFGVNTLWNEENDTTVGYYADIDLSSNTQNAVNMVNLSQEEIE